jgi:hypothetical protein
VITFIDWLRPTEVRGLSPKCAPAPAPDPLSVSFAHPLLPPPSPGHRPPTPGRHPRSATGPRTYPTPSSPGRHPRPATSPRTRQRRPRPGHRRHPQPATGPRAQPTPSSPRPLMSSSLGRLLGSPLRSAACSFNGHDVPSSSCR